MGIYEEKLQQADYKNVLKNFCKISEVPRGSGYNTKISNFFADFAKKNGLSYTQDDSENVIITKPATKGYENVPAVIIQGHMDMVCVKDAESKHDFENDPLELCTDGDWLYARGTTLGGDDGIAAAYGMSLLTDESLPHPELKVIITTDEETGLYGAKALEPRHLDGGYVINCDSEDEGQVLVSCSGGMRVTGSFEFTREKASGTKVNISISGLKGGHSGAEIHKNRTNAVVLMGRILFGLQPEKYGIVNMQGGEKDNAIPNASSAELILNESAAEVLKRLNGISDIIKTELFASEPGLMIDVKASENETGVTVDENTAKKIVSALVLGPNGIRTMSSEIEGLVESSLNLGVFDMSDNRVEIHYSVRSSKTSYKLFTADTLSLLYETLGGKTERHGDYPAWEYKRESKLREFYKKAYRDVTGKDAHFEAIHAGLECGIFCEKNPSLDLISIGPDMRDIHTTRERLSIASSVLVYKTIERCLEIMS